MGKELFNPHLNKFSIRKLNVGVSSVLLSTVFLLGTAATVNADETASGSVGLCYESASQSACS